MLREKSRIEISFLDTAPHIFCRRFFLCHSFQG